MRKSGWHALDKSKTRGSGGMGVRANSVGVRWGSGHREPVGLAAMATNTGSRAGSLIHKRGMEWGLWSLRPCKNGMEERVLTLITKLGCSRGKEGAGEALRFVQVWWPGEPMEEVEKTLVGRE